MKKSSRRSGSWERFISFFAWKRSGASHSFRSMAPVKVKTGAVLARGRKLVGDQDGHQWSAGTAVTDEAGSSRYLVAPEPYRLEASLPGFPEVIVQDRKIVFRQYIPVVNVDLKVGQVAEAGGSFKPTPKMVKTSAVRYLARSSKTKEFSRQTAAQMEEIVTD